MFRICDDIRIRHCGALSFFVNVRSNKIFSIKRQTMDFLLQKLEHGMSEDALSAETPEFLSFVRSLIAKNILRDSLDGIS